jgi:spermidine synthase
MTLRAWIAVMGMLALASECCLMLAAEKEKTIYSKVTPYATILVKEDNEGLRTLWFLGDESPQSAVKVGDPDHIQFKYAQAITVALALFEEPKRVLVVGLGGGTLPSLFRKHYPRMEIDTVDIDPDVVDVAKKFFGFREDATMHAYVEDGRQFIEKCRTPYDIIFLDAYGSEDVPYHMVTKEFLQAVRKATTPKGVVASNIFSADDNPLHDAMIRTYQEVFDSVYLIATKDTNEIVLAMPDKTPLTRTELARRASQFSKDQKLRFNIVSCIRSGFGEPDRKNTSVRVLLDKDKREAPLKE